MNSKDKASRFLKIAHEFQLGHLTTETPHPETSQLSYWAKTNLKQALQVLKAIDLSTLEHLAYHHLPALEVLKKEVKETLQKGHRVFLCGCGATGRLALSLETLTNSPQVLGFMAGGDIAFIKSVEKFEDHPEFGEQQLLELGFMPQDLLISCTEGGETPFVIGATLKAAEISKKKPWFLYCNPDSVLKTKITRSKKILTHPRIQRLSFEIGPMALAGSTRMQATTILMLAVGLALFPELSVHTFKSLVAQTDFEKLIPFIEKEALLYQQNKNITYRSRSYGITVLTDTTERSPTFSLPPFENHNDPHWVPSWCAFHLPQTQNSEQAWQTLLGRKPRALSWSGHEHITGLPRLYGFDFSDEGIKKRNQRLNLEHTTEFLIEQNQGHLQWRLGPLSQTFKTDPHPLFQHLLLKLLLNAHSTLVMGRMNRYENNIMTWVRPSNNKLIDRATRYVQYLLKTQGITRYSYPEIVHALFEEMETLQDHESVVLKTFHKLKTL